MEGNKQPHWQQGGRKCESIYIEKRNYENAKKRS